MSYNVISLKSICNLLGEENVVNKLKSFKCNANQDIENFLKNSSIEFSKKGIAETFIVLRYYNGVQVIVGYFALAHKIIRVPRDTFKGKTKHRLLRFNQANQEENEYLIAVPLIGQLSKNYNSKYNELITGNQLLELAFDKIKIVQKIIGGKFVFLECEDNEKLKNFYEKNGFKYFSERVLDEDEKEQNIGEHLLQMICDLSNY